MRSGRAGELQTYIYLLTRDELDGDNAEHGRGNRRRDGRCGPLPGGSGGRIRRAIRHPTRRFAGAAGDQLLRPEPGVRSRRGIRGRKGHLSYRFAAIVGSSHGSCSGACGAGPVGLFPAGVSVAGMVSAGVGVRRVAGYLRGGQSAPRVSLATASGSDRAAAFASASRHRCTEQ